MVTVILTIELELLEVNSLKDKRRILKSMMTKLRNKFNISISEVGHNDQLRRAILGASIVSNDSGFGHSVIAKVVDKVRSNTSLLILDYRTETY